MSPLNGDRPTPDSWTKRPEAEDVKLIYYERN